MPKKWTLIFSFIITFAFTLLHILAEYLPVSLVSSVVFALLTMILSFFLTTVSVAIIEKLLESHLKLYFVLKNNKYNKHAVSILEGRMSAVHEEMVSFQESDKFVIKSHDLYFHIKEFIQKSDKVNIIDHNITRWEEMLDNERGYVFNNSVDIFDSTRYRATKCKNFDLKRIFIITLDEWKQITGCEKTTCSNGDGCSNYDECRKIKNISGTSKSGEVIKSFSKAERKILGDETAGNMETRLCIAEWLKKQAPPCYEKLLEVKDVVFCDKHLIFRESFSIEYRENAKETKAEISCSPVEVRDSHELFSQIWDNKCTIALN